MSLQVFGREAQTGKGKKKKREVSNQKVEGENSERKGTVPQTSTEPVWRTGKANGGGGGGRRKPERCGLVFLGNEREREKPCPSVHKRKKGRGGKEGTYFFSRIMRRIKDRRKGRTGKKVIALFKGGTCGLGGGKNQKKKKGAGLGWRVFEGEKKKGRKKGNGRKSHRRLREQSSEVEDGQFKRTQIGMH